MPNRQILNGQADVSKNVRFCAKMVFCRLKCLLVVAAFACTAQSAVQVELCLDDYGNFADCPKETVSAQIHTVAAPAKEEQTSLSYSADVSRAAVHTHSFSSPCHLIGDT